MRLIFKLVWGVGAAAWTFGIADRSIAATLDNSLSAVDVTLLLTAGFFATCWVILGAIAYLVDRGEW